MGHRRPVTAVHTKREKQKRREREVTFYLQLSVLIDQLAIYGICLGDMSRHANNKNVDSTHVERISAQRGGVGVEGESVKAKASEGKEKIVTLPTEVKMCTVAIYFLWQ